MKLDDHEQRKFSLYCKHMADAEAMHLDAKSKMFEKQSFAKPLVDEMTKRDHMRIMAYAIVAEELDKWTITANDIGSNPS
jgi:hypothetical protein